MSRTQEEVTGSSIVSTPTQTSSNIFLHPENARFHHLDNLRAMAMLVGILFHVSIAYMPINHETWVVSNTTHSTSLEAIAYFTHLFRMPLFMFIAGFFGHYLLMKHGVNGFIKNRSQRVLAPFVILLPILLAAMIGVVIYAAYNAQHRPPALMFIVNNYQNPQVMNTQFSTMHLWFLYNLLIFYVSALLLIKLAPFNLNKWLSRRSSIALKVTLLQVLLLDKNWNVWLEFLLTSVTTFAIGLLSYQLLVRHTPIGWMLNGRRKKS